MAVPEIDQGPGNNTWESSKFTVSAAYVDDVTYYSSYVYSYSATSAPRDTQLWTFGSTVENHWANIGASDALSVAIGRSDGNITSYNIYPTEVATNPTITDGILYINVPYNTRLLVTVNGDHANALSLFSSPLKDSIPGTKTDWSTLSKTVTNVDTTNNIVEINDGHGIPVGNVDRVVFHSTGDMFEGVGLSANEPVYVSAIDANNVAVYENKYQDIGSQVDIVSGAPLDLTSEGTGTITMTPVDWYNTTSTLYFPPGEHWIGKSFRLGNDVDVYIDSGAVLVGGFGLRHNTDGPLTTSYTTATGVTIRGAGNLLGKYVAFSQLPSVYKQQLSYSMFDGGSYGNNSLKNITVACAPYRFGEGGFSELLNCKFISPTESQGMGITGNNYGAALGVISSCYSFASENAVKADYVSDGVGIYDSFLLASYGFCYFGGNTSIYSKNNTTREEIPVRNCTFMSIAWPAADTEFMRTQKSTDSYKQIGSRGIVGITTDSNNINDGYWNGKVSFSSCVVNEAVSNRPSSGIPRVFVLGNVPYIYGPRELYGSTKEVTVDNFTINGSPVQKSLVASFNGAETPSGLTFTNVNVDGTVVTDNNYWDYFEFKNTYNKEIGISYAKDVSFNPVDLYTNPGPGLGDRWQSGLYEVSATADFQNVYSAFVYSFSSYNQRRSVWHGPTNWEGDPSTWTDGVHWVDLGTSSQVTAVIARKDLAISSVEIWPKEPAVEYYLNVPGYEGKAIVVMPQNTRLRIEVNGDHKTAISIFTSPIQQKPDNVISINNFLYDVSTVNVGADTVTVPNHGITPGDVQRVVFHSDGDMFGTDPLPGFNSSAVSANEVIWASAINDSDLALYRANWLDSVINNELYSVSGERLNVISTGTGNITMIKADWSNTTNPLYFNRGEHWAGRLFRLSDDTNVYIDRGAVAEVNFDLRPYDSSGHLAGHATNIWSQRVSGVTIEGPGTLANDFVERKDLPDYTALGDYNLFQGQLTTTTFRGRGMSNIVIKGITVAKLPFYCALGINKHINVKVINPFVWNADGLRANANNIDNTPGLVSACYTLAGDDAVFVDGFFRGVHIVDSFITTTENSCVHGSYWPTLYDGDTQFRTSSRIDNCDFINSFYEPYAYGFSDAGSMQNTAGSVIEPIGHNSVFKWLTDGWDEENAPVTGYGSGGQESWWDGDCTITNCRVWAPSGEGSIIRPLILGNVRYPFESESQGRRQLKGTVSGIHINGLTFENTPVQNIVIFSHEASATPRDIQFNNVKIGDTVIDENNYFNYVDFRNTRNQDIGRSYARDVTFNPVGLYTDPGPGVNGWESSLYKVSATDGIGAIFSSFVYSFSSYNMRYQLWAEKYNNYGNDPSDWTDGEHWVDIGTVQDVGCFVIIGREDLSISSISIWPKNVVEYSDVDNLYPGKALIAVPHNKRIRVEVNGDPTTALHIFTSPTETKPNNLVSIGNYTYDVSSVDTLGDTVSISYGHGMTPGDIQRVVFHSDGELFGTSPAMGYNSTLSANEIIWASAVDDTKLALYNSEMTQTADIYNTSAVYFISGTALDITSTGTGNITMLKPDWNDTANTLYFHRGEHWAGKLFRLNEDCKVYLDRGSVVQGSFDIRPYEPDGIHLPGYSGGNLYSYRNNGIEIYGKGILANSYRGRADTIPLTFPGFKEFQVNLTENALLGLATNDSSVRGITVVTPAFYLDLAIHEFINVKYFNPYQGNADGFRATIDNSQNAGVISACFALAGDDAFSETRGTNITDSFLTTSDNSIINIKYWPGYSQSEVQYKAPLIAKNCDFLHGGLNFNDPTNPWIDRDIFQTPAGDIGEAIGTDAIISCLTDGAEGEEESWNGSAVISSCRVWNPSSDGSIRRPLVLGNVRYPFYGINALNQRDQRGQVSSIVLDSVWFESKPAMNAIMVSYDASSTPHDIQFNNVSAGNTVIDENNYFNYVDFRNTRNQDIGRSYARDVSFDPVGLYVDPGPGLGDRWQSGLYEVSATADFQNVYSAFVYSFSSYNMRPSLWHGPKNWNNGSDPSTWTDGVHWVDLGTSSQVTAVIARKDLAISSVEIWPKEPAVEYYLNVPGYEGKALIVMPQNIRLRVEVNEDHKTAISIFTSPIQQKPDNVISINNFLYDVSTVNVGASTVTVPDHGITGIERVVFHSDGDMFGTDPLPGFNSSAVSANEVIWASAINDSDLALYRANWLESIINNEVYSVSGERLNVTSTGTGNITMIKTDWSNTTNPLYFNRGEHWAGRLYRLNNDTNVYIDRGAVVEASFDLRPYDSSGYLAGHDSDIWSQRVSGVTIEGPGTVANDFAERKDLPDYQTSLGLSDLFQGQLTNTAFRGRTSSNIVLKGFTLAKIPFYTSLGVNKHINVKLFNPFIYNGDGLRSGANTIDNTPGLVSACYTLAGDDAVFTAGVRGVDIVDSFITTTNNSCLHGSYWPEHYDGELQFYTSSTVDNCDFLHGYYNEDEFGFSDSGSLQNTLGTVNWAIGTNSVIKWLTDGWDAVSAPPTGYGSGGQDFWWVGDTKITNCRVWAPSGEGSIVRPLVLGNVQYPFQNTENATGRRQLRGSVSGVDISGLTFENTPAQNILIVSFDAVSGTPHDISLRDVNIGGTLIDSFNYETFIDFIDTSGVDIGYGEVGSIAYNFTFDQLPGWVQKQLGEIIINMSLPRAPNADSLNYPSG